MHFNTLIDNGYATILCALTDEAGVSAVCHNGCRDVSRNALYGLTITITNAGNNHELHVDSSRFDGFRQAGVMVTGPFPCSLHCDTVVRNRTGLLCVGGSAPRVRGSIFDGWDASDVSAGVWCEEQSYPDLGDVENNQTGPGSNSFLQLTGVAVANQNPEPQQYV